MNFLDIHRVEEQEEQNPTLALTFGIRSNQHQIHLDEYAFGIRHDSVSFTSHYPTYKIRRR